MKKITLTIILLFFFFHDGQCQTTSRIIKETTSFRPASGFDYALFEEINYNYNFYGDTTLIETKEFIGQFNSTDTWEGEFYEYDISRFLKRKSQKRYNSDVDLWLTDSWIDYDYDLNGCLIEESYIKNVGDIYLSNKVYYQRNLLCQPLSKYKEKYYIFQGDTLSSVDFHEREYYSDGISYEERYFENVAFADSQFLENTKVYIYNDKNKIIEQVHIHFINNDSIPYQNIAKKELYEYDEYNNVIEIIENVQGHDTSDWILTEIKFFENEYDEDGFLIKTKKEVYDNTFIFPGINDSSTRIFDYKNSCKGFLEEKMTSYVTSNKNLKREFFYEGIDECLDLGELDLNILVYPNPTSGHVEIISSIFQTGNTEILVYSIDGKVLLQKSEISRSESSSLDLSFLQNGFYFLQLGNGNHFVKSKIVIAK